MNEETTHLDLCSGIGGFALAIADAAKRTDRNVSTIAFCEPDKFCQQVLAKHWPDVAIYDDVKTFPRDFGKVDILTAGYPCQPFSQAGKRKGTADDRHIWPWVLGIVKQTRPDVCVFENVVGHISMGLDEVLLDLENEGYHAWPCIIGAVSKNAPHRRQRVWIVAYANSQSEPDGSQHEQRMVADTGGKRCEPSGTTEKMDQKGRREEVRGRELNVFTTSGNPNVADTDSGTERATHRIDQGIGQQYGDEPDIGQGREVGSHLGDSGEDVADTQSKRIQGHGASGEQEPQAYAGQKIPVCGGERGGQTEGPVISRMGGTFDGLSTWVDGDWERGVPRVTEGQKDRAKRLKALGNAIVPQVASEIFTAIFESDLA